MSNVLVVAKKEFVDLLSNRMVLFVVIAYLIYSVFVVHDFSVVFSGRQPGYRVLFQDNPGIAGANSVFFMLTWFGTLLGIIVGCSTISSERICNALNTIVSKPLFRDTIINGKLLGSIAFLACIMAMVIAIFTSSFLVLLGNAFSSYLFDYLARLPFVFLFAMIFVMVFLTVSVLISLLVKDQAFAMILSILAVYFSMIMCFQDIAGNINNLLPGYGLNTIFIGLSPYGILNRVQHIMLNTEVGAVEAFLSVLPDITKLLLYVIIALFLSYLIFTKKDLS